MKYLILSFLFLSACASYEVTPSGRTVLTTENYIDVIERNSDKVRRYSGFHNTLDMQATMINSQVAQAQLAQSGMLYQWDESTAAAEKAKFEDRLSKQTEVFLSFYTPERKNDDLLKKNTMWKVFLDVDGKRYEGSVTRLRKQLAEIEGLYPYHNRFYSPYILTFPVPMRSIDGKEARVTMTGVVGSGELVFKN